MTVATIRVVGNVTEALASLEALGIKAEETGHKVERDLGGGASRAGGIFTRLGTQMQNWGVPFGRSMTEVGNRISEADTRSGKFKDTLDGIGKVALIAGTAGFAVIGAESVKMAGNFQSAAEHLVTDAGESQSALKGVEQGMLNISSATGTSASSIVDGMYHIESAGYHGKAALDLLKTAAEGAKTGGADLDTVAKTLTGTMNAYNIPASKSVSVMNELIATVGSGDMRMQDLASSLGAVAPQAAAAHISLAQVGGAIATMTGQNMSAQQATQDLAHTIRSLQAPNSVAINEMSQFGINANSVSKNLGKNGLTGTLQSLSETILSHMGPSGMVLLKAFNQSTGASKDMQIELHQMPPSLQKVAKSFEDGRMTTKQWTTAIKGMTPAQADMAKGFAATFHQSHKFNALLTSGAPAAQTYTAALSKMTGGATGLNTTLMLTGGRMATFEANTRHVQEAADHSGKSVEGWGEIQKTFNQQLDVAKTSVENLGIKLGLALIPYVEKAITAISNIVGWFEKHTTAAKILAGVIGGVLAVAIGTTIVLKIQSFVGKLKDASRAMHLIGDSDSPGLISKLGSLGSAVAKTGLQFAKTAAKAVASSAVWVAQQAVATATTVAGYVAQAAAATAAFIAENAATLGIIAAIGLLIAAAIWAATHWHEVWSAIKEAVHWAWDQIQPVFETVRHVISDVLTAAISVFKGIWHVYWTMISTEITVMWAVIQPIFDLVKSAIQNGITSVVTTFQSTWHTVWSAVQNAVSTMWGLVSPIFSEVESGISSGITGAINGLESVWSGVWNSVKSAVSNAWSVISPLFNSISGAVSGIVNGVGKIVGAISKIPGGGVIKGIGHLLGFADGGRPPVGQWSIVGEKGPELFLPDSPGTIVPNSALTNMSSGGLGFSGNSVADREQSIRDMYSALAMFFNGAILRTQDVTRNGVASYLRTV